MAVASRLDTGRAFAKVLLPTLAKGVIVRRPPVMAMAEKMQADAVAVATMMRFRQRYGPQPLRLRVTGRSIALLLDPVDVSRLLADSPSPFALATREKKAALAHFQPHGVLISTGEERARRRALNEEVLRPEKIDAQGIVADEADLLLRHVRSSGVLTWDSFAQAWWRAARRIVLGSFAREDVELTDMLKTLRGHANWAYLHPRREGLRRRFDGRLRRHLERREPNSLASLAPADDVAEQAPHWLFAFDAAGIVTMRALAIGGSGQAGIWESARLWPTTPVILRESTEPTHWHGAWLPAGTTFVVFAPYFHRDRERLPYADEYAPDIWPTPPEPALVPFSGGPGVCPGRDLVLVAASTMLDTLRDHLAVPTLHAPLPTTLNHFALSFDAVNTTG
ncbi:cytochrome P450 [Saccharothrix ecbatanensis]|uniref:Cytochrome P450 n=1 Tax=Saccharothrix ecbatanensis TaxID=1105145 RepID=A0A7W9HEE2_9PSEU|nr:cytochrome P450 [Saccharothrix ecbatanensis]MBB5800690.1 cytochrome P450 [Saccharothrix ecbatanensis]